MEVDNSSYLTVSHDGRMLYSIADEGVVAFRILENGALSRVNSANIKAMRGCHIATDAEDKFIFVSGYHDGKGDGGPPETGRFYRGSDRRRLPQGT